MTRILVFDVNETLLDLGVLDVHFARLFGTPQAKDAWFKQVLQSALVMNILGQYTDFGTVGRIALDMTALRYKRELSDVDRDVISTAMRTLPPHPEVKHALDMLRDAGFRLAALTNSAQDAAEAQLANAGLDHYFEAVMSVDAVQKFKPAIEVYQMAAKTLQAQPEDLRLIAAHDWDVMGAMHAGWRAAFVARPGMVIAPQAKQPDIIGANLHAVARQIIHFEVPLQK